jgi:hypothetical protein
MRHLPLALTLPALGLIASCPSDPDPVNPERLYLALLINETMVQLVPEEPEPF